MKTKIRWICETAILLALLVVLQAVTKPFGTIVTGSAVNFVLIAAALLLGITSGLTVAVISPFLALLLGIASLSIYVVPVVALGNVAIVLVFSLLLYKQQGYHEGKALLRWIIAIIGGAGFKFCVLYAGAVWVVMPIMTAVKGAGAKIPAAIFSVQQIPTALIGGILALLIVPTVKKALSKRKS